MIDSDINKYSIEFMSTSWIITVACVIALIFIVLYVGHNLPAIKKEKYAKFLAALMIGFFIVNHSLLFFLGKWEISKELPVHLCSISGLICCFIMFIPKNKRQFLFEFLFYCGIIGGIRSGTEFSTKNILLESAYFLPRSIRKTSKLLNIDTDAKFRFERGIDPQSCLLYTSPSPRDRG